MKPSEEETAAKLRGQWMALLRLKLSTFKQEVIHPRIFLPAKRAARTGISRHECQNTPSQIACKAWVLVGLVRVSIRDHSRFRCHVWKLQSWSKLQSCKHCEGHNVATCCRGTTSHVSVSPHQRVACFASAVSGSLLVLSCLYEGCCVMLEVRLSACQVVAWTGHQGTPDRFNTLLWWQTIHLWACESIV